MSLDLLLSNNMNAKASPLISSHHSEHERIQKLVLPLKACTYNFHRLWIELASIVIDLSFRHVSSPSPSWCHLDSSWTRWDCDYETFLHCAAIFRENWVELICVEKQRVEEQWMRETVKWIEIYFTLLTRFSFKHFTIESMELDGSLHLEYKLRFKTLTE